MMNSDNTTQQGGLHKQETALFPVRLFPEASYYAAMARHSRVAFDTDARYNKPEKGVHRFTIADVAGTLRLTVPVSRPSGATLWRQTLVSDHGRWWETMPIALESAYGRTPFFEFYIDRFLPLFSPEPVPITELCLRADRIVRGILRTSSTIVEAASVPDAVCYTDADFAAMELPQYWQVRAHKLGFIPHLSVLDLIFNLGPEAELLLDRYN